MRCERCNGSACAVLCHAVTVNIFHDICSLPSTSGKYVSFRHTVLMAVRGEEMPAVMETVKDCMEHVLDLPVPLIAEVRSGSSWYDTK